MQIPTVKIKADNARGFKIVNADDPRVQKVEEKTDFSPDGIAAMPKADVIDLLEFHSAKFDKRWGVDRLRDLLTETMFTGL